MKHWVVAHRRVPGTLAALRRRLRTEITNLLRAATDTEDEAPEPDGSMLLELPAQVLGLDLHKQVRARVGVALDHGDRTSSPAVGGRARSARVSGLSRHHRARAADITVRAQLTVVGAVTPPLGPVGALADAAVLGVAR